MRTVWDIIKSPVITEKALVAKEESQDTGQLLSFRVDRKATKPEIKSAVETIFQVKVDRVRTINFMGKMARRGRFEGRKPSWKKAYVTLKEGEKTVDYGEAIYGLPIGNCRLVVGQRSVLESSIGNRQSEIKIWALRN